jgi:uncharacterized protein
MTSVDLPQVIVVGAGPGGLFAALRLVELGLRPIVIERGKDVRERKKDLAQISREHTVDPESNYSFGEGGAGAYSDGKLYTRSKKRGNVDKILNVFCQHGASTSILVDAHPHIGTDKLPRVIENMRNTIIECGGEVHFQTRMDALIIENDEVKGIETNTGKTFLGPVILATGHSARDVYRWLAANNVTIEAKGIAVGVRLEHPAMLIDQIQYHNKNGRGKYLPAAEYSFVTQAEGRGVYSFCMCPGGFIVPAASRPEQVVVNGMSPANRGSRWSNSGMVVEIQPEDLGNEELKMRNEELAAQQDEQLMALNPNLKSSQLSEINSQLLSVLHFQEELERQCWLQGGRRQTAPAQRMLAVLEKRVGFKLAQKDVFLNIAGGLKVNDPAIDLPVISAILSSNMDAAIEPEVCMAGEIGLSGEIRPVNRIEQRIGEAEKLGFKRFLLPKYNLQGIDTQKLKIELVPVRKVEEAFRALFG